MPRLSIGHKANFDMLKKACENGDLALMDCQISETGESVAVICLVNRPDKSSDYYEILPIAMMFNGDPFDILNPPNMDEDGYAFPDSVHKGE